jgi:hypothetical protein
MDAVVTSLKRLKEIAMAACEKKEFNTAAVQFPQYFTPEMALQVIDNSEMWAERYEAVWATNNKLIEVVEAAREMRKHADSRFVESVAAIDAFDEALKKLGDG